MTEVTRKEIARRRALLVLIHDNPLQLAVVSVQGRQFPLFNKLPPELRNKVWKELLPGPRTVTIYDGVTDDTTPYNARAKATPVPVLLHICKESRDLALGFYRLSFKVQLRNRPVYFDFKRDLLYITRENSMNAFYNRCSLKERPEDLHEMAEVEAIVQRLEVDTTCLCSSKVVMVSRFHNLKLLRLSSVWRAPRDRLKYNTEKFLVKAWKKHAKAGGWELKIPKLDLGPSLGIGPEVPIRDMIE